MKWNEGFFSKILTSPGVTSIVRDEAEETAAAARAAAPVDTGAYRDSIHVEVVQTAYRSVARVVASDPKALLLESKYGVLSRALGRVVGHG
jgi:ABC-type uncharacterized transport system YnjBCD ATPase subunit